MSRATEKPNNMALQMRDQLVLVGQAQGFATDEDELDIKTELRVSYLPNG